MENRYDVIVVGGGASGIGVAAAMQEKGLKVLVVERSGRLGGAVEGGNGLFGIQSRQQIEAGVTYTRQDVFEFLMQHSHYKTDANLVSAFVNNCTPAIEWLERLGVQFGLCSKEESIYFQSWHTIQPQSRRITQVLASDFQNHGGHVALNTEVTQLLLEHNKVIGVEVADLEGQLLSVYAPAVVLAAGGCASNEEMIRTYTRFTPGKDYMMFELPPEAPKAVGTGLKLAWAAGARKSDIVMDTYLCMPAPYGGGGGTCPELRLYHNPNLMVNCKGQRVCNEEIIVNGAFAGNVAIIQPDGCLYGIVSEEIAEVYEEDCRLHPPMTPFGPAPACTPFRTFFKSAVQEGADCLYMADTLEELAAQFGADPQTLRQTVQSYDEMCRKGEDTQFFKSPKHMKPIQGSRYYAVKFMVTAYGSFGGVDIDAEGRVLDQEGMPIPGLYCTGMDANHINADSYTHQMTGSTSAFNFAMALVEARAIANELGR